MGQGYFREGKHYRIDNVKDELKVDGKEARSLIGTLKKYGIVKAVNINSPEYAELSNEDIVLTDTEDDSSDVYYVFDFVGVVSLHGHALKCYPKYIKGYEESQKTIKTEDLLAAFKKVLKVIQKYNSKEQLLYLLSGEDGDRIFNKMVVAIHLIEEYLNYGLYTNEQEIIETNGEGDILWNRTIDETYAIIKNSQPYYVELQTRRNVADDVNYFKRLHECVLTVCSKELHDTGILELFDLPPVELTREELNDFGDVDYILYRLEREMQVQFVTRKQTLLKILYTYIANSKTDKNNDSLSFFGTNSFNMIWERACADVFDNKLKTPLKDLDINQDLVAARYNPDDSLISLINKPTWYVNGKKNVVEDTLKPDLISFGKIDGGDYYFIILDAKYYDMTVDCENKIKGNPGIGDVTKQYLYQLAYNDFIKMLGENTIINNCFLMPTQDYKVKGDICVSLDMLHNLGLNDIQVRYVPVDLVYDHYLAGGHIEISELGLF